MGDIRTSQFGGIPFGNTANRPSPTTGQPYFNGEAQRLELYTNAGSWENIVQEVPGVSSISGTYSEASNSGTILIYGTNFVNGAYATAIGSNGVQVNASSTTYNSLVQLTAVFANLSNAYEPYDIKVTNPSNLFGLIPDALYINASPVWTTSAGSLGTFNEQVSISVSATATDSDSTISYAVANGSSLPSGVTLNSSSGLISGTLPDISTSTTYTFTINASDGVNTIPRTFSITSNPTPTSIELLLVAGGGGGGCDRAGGGGGGGLIYNSSYALSGKTFAITVGTGGSGATDDTQRGGNGTDSIFGSLTAVGGGGGGSENNKNGSSGGSGGGASYGNGATGGAATSGQGYRGGNGKDNGRAPGGGGGAGQQGTDGADNTRINGGNGLAYSITGTSTYYAGGGGAGDNRDGAGTAIGGFGGLGGGGNGAQSYSSDPNGYPGTDGLGGGGGGGSTSNTGIGAKGGSGTVIIAYPDTFAALSSIPGTLTYDQPTRSGYRVYRFTAGTGTITL